MFELELDALLAHLPGVRHYRAVPPYPSVEEDIAVVVDETVPAARVQSIVEEAPLVLSARLFDVYTGPQVPGGKKSLAFAVSYQSPDHTLTDEEVARERERIVRRLKREVGAALRG